VEHDELKASIDKLTDATLALAKVQTIVGKALIEVLKRGEPKVGVPFSPALPDDALITPDDSLESRLAAVRD
jgi:hypothetical protein